MTLPNLRLRELKSVIKTLKYLRKVFLMELLTGNIDKRIFVKILLTRL